MSLHKKPLSELEREGLEAHGLDIGKPSQLSDVFRLGVAWALRQESETKAQAVDEAYLNGARGFREHLATYFKPVTMDKAWEEFSKQHRDSKQ